MASKRSLRTLISATASPLRPTPSHRSPFTHQSSTCAFSTTAVPRHPSHEIDPPTDIESALPRWQQTPRRMTAPIRIRPVAPGGEFRVNEDPRKLDDAYVRLLGLGGERMLEEETKWLAVTHKSFDHGRRGFNDRLAYLGRRIVELQTSQALISSPQREEWSLDAAGEPVPDQFGRRPYLHPALSGLQGLNDEAEGMVLSKTRLSQLAERYGLDKVTRWKPKRADRLQGSGIESVLMTSLYAIVGAVALECGGEVANKLVQEKILTPLGLNFAVNER